MFWSVVLSQPQKKEGRLLTGMSTHGGLIVRVVELSRENKRIMLDFEKLQQSLLRKEGKKGLGWVP